MTKKYIIKNCCNDKECRQCSFEEQLKRKEQECKELVSKCNQLDKKCKQQSWDIGNLGYKIKNQRHEINNRLKQLGQLKAENETLKAEYTRVHTQLASQEAYILVDGEEVWRGPTRKLKQENEKLKAENEKLKQYKEVVDKLAGMQVILTNEEKMPMLYENAKDLKLKQLSKTLIEIKEISNYSFNLSTSELMAKLEQILQKISEVENG